MDNRILQNVRELKVTGDRSVINHRIKSEKDNALIVYLKALIANASSKYLYWLVSDAAQRFTLEKNGYQSLWWDLYKNAVNKNRDNCCFEDFAINAADKFCNRQTGNDGSVFLMR